MSTYADIPVMLDTDKARRLALAVSLFVEYMNANDSRRAFSDPKYSEEYRVMKQALREVMR